MDALKELQKNDPDKAAAVAAGGYVYPQLFGGENINDLCTKITNYVPVVEAVEKDQGDEGQPTNQQDHRLATQMTLPPPVDIVAARALKDISPHHASCIQSKKYSMVGLGFVSEASEIEDSKNRKPDSTGDTENKIATLLNGEAFLVSKVDELLDPLCLTSFMDELYRNTEDFLDGGTGYLEVVRDKDNKIVGISWLPYEDIEIGTIKDDNNRNIIVFKYTNISSRMGGTSTYYSLFGKENRKKVWEHFYQNKSDDTAETDTDISRTDEIPIEQVSEVIPFLLPSNRCKFYGYPEWLAANSFITLLAKALQYKSDFYTNRGVLAYILGISGNMDDDKFKEIEKLVQGSVGEGHNWKNLAIKIGDPKGKITVNKLAASDKTEEQFKSDAEVLSQSIVSAHRVPPVLANILIPGKLGATNEAVQALVSFQLLVVGPYQTMIQKTLARTLGSKEDGVAGLTPEAFRLRTITSQFDITGLDTIGRAREEATGSGRDFSQGLND